MHVEDFAVGSQATMEVVAVPRCLACLVIVRLMLGDIGAARNLVGFAHLVVSPTLPEIALAVRDACARRHTIFGVVTAFLFLDVVPEQATSETATAAIAKKRKDIKGVP